MHAISHYFLFLPVFLSADVTCFAVGAAGGGGGCVLVTCSACPVSLMCWKSLFREGNCFWQTLHSVSESLSRGVFLDWVAFFFDFAFAFCLAREHHSLQGKHDCPNISLHSIYNRVCLD